MKNKLKFGWNVSWLFFLTWLNLSLRVVVLLLVPVLIMLPFTTRYLPVLYVCYLFYTFVCNLAAFLIEWGSVLYLCRIK